MMPQDYIYNPGDLFRRLFMSITRKDALNF